MTANEIINRYRNILSILHKIGRILIFTIIELADTILTALSAFRYQGKDFMGSSFSTFKWRVSLYRHTNVTCPSNSAMILVRLAL